MRLSALLRSPFTPRWTLSILSSACEESALNHLFGPSFLPHLSVSLHLAYDGEDSTASTLVVQIHRQVPKPTANHSEWNIRLDTPWSWFSCNKQFRMANLKIGCPKMDILPKGGAHPLGVGLKSGEASALDDSVATWVQLLISTHLQ